MRRNCVNASSLVYIAFPILRRRFFFDSTSTHAHWRTLIILSTETYGTFLCHAPLLICNITRKYWPLYDRVPGVLYRYDRGHLLRGDSAKYCLYLSSSSVTSLTSWQNLHDFSILFLLIVYCIVFLLLVMVTISNISSFLLPSSLSKPSDDNWHEAL